MFERFRRWRRRRAAALAYDPHYGVRSRGGHDHEHEHGHRGHHDHHHDHHNHGGRYRGRRCVAFTTALFTFATFVLFVLVALSIPIIKVVWLFTVHAKVNGNAPATSIATELRLGARLETLRSLSRKAEVPAIRSVGHLRREVCILLALFSPRGPRLTSASLRSRLGSETCYGPTLGYSLTYPVDVSALLGESTLVDVVQDSLTTVLVLHAVCAGIALLVLLLSACLWSRGTSVAALVLSVLLSVLSTLILAIDLAIGLTAQSKVPDLTDGSFVLFEWRVIYYRF
jgi:hypothetical protein